MQRKRVSRTISIKSSLFIENRRIAIEVIKEFRNGIYVDENHFRFEKYDAYDQVSQYQKEREMEKVEREYQRRYELFLEEEKRKKEELERKRIEAEKRAIQEEIERLKREEEERKRTEELERKQIEAEKLRIREEKADLIIKNAEKQGYKLKKEIKKDNTIQLVLQKRIY